MSGGRNVARSARVLVSISSWPAAVAAPICTDRRYLLIPDTFHAP